MTLPKGWRLGVLAATVIALVSELVYVYGIHFQRLIHSDAAASLLMGRSALQSHALIPPRWYWGNGDVWFLFVPLAALPTALFGVGIGTLRLMDVLGFALEIGVLAWCYRQLGARRWVALLAACTTLLGLSRLHLVFVFVELAYGFVLTIYLFAFVQLARLLPAEGETRVPRWRWLGAGLVVTAVSLSNPTRFVAFGLLPLLVPALWPWRQVSLRFRAAYAALVVGAHVVALVVYHRVFERLLTFSPIAAHETFRIKDAAGIEENLVMFGRGVLAFTGDPGLSLGSIPGLVLVLGAVGVTIRLVLGGRELTRIRFLGVVLGSAAGAVVVPMLVANFMLGPLSIRYLMPSVLPMLGLAVVLLAEREAPLAKAWLVLVPVMGFLGLSRMVDTQLEAANAQWSNRLGHTALADELTHRGLTHGFATYWNADLVTLLAHDASHVCPIYATGAGFIPQKWGIDSTCFDREHVPAEIFFAAAVEERPKFTASMEAAFGPPRERFMVGDAFEVSVYPTANLPLGWLDLPIPSGEAIKFPLVLAATHDQIRRGTGVVVPGGVLATGEGGAIVFGPYVDMQKGHYRATWIGTAVDSPGSIGFDVRSDKTGDLARTGAKTSELAGKTHAELGSVPFTLVENTEAIVLRAHSQNGGKVLLEQLRIDRE